MKEILFTLFDMKYPETVSLLWGEGVVFSCSWKDGFSKVQKELGSSQKIGIAHLIRTASVSVPW